jgi:hypothetical protein
MKKIFPLFIAPVVMDVNDPIVPVIRAGFSKDFKNS